MMNESAALLDSDGTIALTASGKSGGGAWRVELRPEASHVQIRWLLAVLNSKSRLYTKLL